MGASPASDTNSIITNHIPYHEGEFFFISLILSLPQCLSSSKSLQLKLFSMRMMQVQILPVAEADLWKKLLALLGVMDVQPIQKSVWEQDYEIAKKLLRVAEFNASSPEEKDLA